MEIEIDSLIVIDDKVWKVESFPVEGKCRAVHDSGNAIWFNTPDAIYLGNGLFGLSGRISSNPSPSVVTEPAIINTGN